MADFATRLKKLRKGNNIMQKELAKELNLVQTTIANYEKNLRFPNQENLTKIADYFNVSLDYLLGRTDIAVNSLELLKENEKKINELNLDNPHSSLMESYLQALLECNKEKAINLIHEAIKEGISLEDIYLYVFEPALKKIGYLWEKAEVTVDEEHYCTELTKQLMSRFFSYMNKNSTKNYTVVSVSASGESHDVGLRMITDILELDGWNAYYLGPNTPTENIINAIANNKAEILAVSVTMLNHIETAKNLIEAVRNNPNSQGVKILVGGKAFNQKQNLWKKIRADGYSDSLKNVRKVANELINQ
ncbi:cobalamin-dependent protein [Natranaerofaba carboxydovora]|uniref:cobalamin-dependent protein n=1 Tax=Natranaerofaba carboxydovora TaxID=2742683 RepID=UPI001F147A90|nr:cobalamin-dependent protein [Natranaerofaba carboxydovora]UMZ73684.1 HTH-type transcriptional regulator ImmR [Natranaerofaba carboxydovora]